MGEAHTFHGRWEHGGGIITAVIELLKQKLLWRLCFFLSSCMILLEPPLDLIQSSEVQAGGYM